MKSKKPLNEKQTRELVRNIIKEVYEELGDALDTDMNKMDDVHTKNHPNNLVGSSKSLNKPSQKTVDTKKVNESKSDYYDVVGDATDIKMNSQEKKTPVKSEFKTMVKAKSSTHSGDDTKGMHKSDFETKSGMNDSNEIGGKEKGDPHYETDMNQMDHIEDKGAKTYVEPGSELKKGASKGQKDAKWSEDAKNEKDSYDKIADAIELDELNGRKLTEKELENFISEQAFKIKKLMI